MSHRATTWAFEQRGLKPATRVVLLYLADRHNPDFGCFPSQDQLAYDCEMSRRSVNDHLETLEQNGLIKRVRRVNPETRKQMSTRYILGFEADFPQEPCANSAHGNGSEPCANSDKSRVQILHTNLVREPVNTTAHSREVEAEALCLDACGPGLCDSGRKAIRSTASVIGDWLGDGLDLEQDVLPVLKARTAKASDRVIRTWDYFSVAVRRAHQHRLAALRRGQNAEKQHACKSGADSDPIVRLADWINSGARVPPSAVTNTQRDALIARSLVTLDQLRNLQIY